MKKIILIILLCFLLSSCSMVHTTRKITITIPSHPWEIASGRKIWYTLKWTDGKTIHSTHLSDERSYEINVPVGETIFVCAFPLGDMSPFGIAITPLDNSDSYCLSQNEGYLIANLMDLDLSVTRGLNYPKLRERLLMTTTDFRCLDLVVLLRDLQNGKLSDLSIKKVNMFGVEEFALANGIWISEFIADSSFVISDNEAGPTELPEGVFRYLNNEMDRVLIVVVDSNGEFYSYLKQVQF